MNNKNKIIIGLCGLLVLGSLTGAYMAFAQNSEIKTTEIGKPKHTTSNDLFKINTNSGIVYINEIGEEKINLDRNKYTYAGEFNEGRAFVAKEIKELPPRGMFDEYVAKIFIIDTFGNVVKELPYNAIVSADYDLPIFQDSKAIMELENETYISINSNGEKIKEVSSEEAEGQDINASYNPEFTHSVKYPIDKTAPRPFAYGGDSGDKYIAYKDSKGKTVIDIQALNPYGSDDLTMDIHFYNGVAMVFGDSNGRRFINTKGEFINQDVYDYATPFWKKLAYVETNNKYGYINTKGEWVWARELTNRR